LAQQVLQSVCQQVSKVVEVFLFHNKTPESIYFYIKKEE
jgi:hypothetical protein